MTGVSTSTSDRDAVAADWLLRLRESNVPEATLSAWIAWCAEDPRNREAFEAMDELWSLAGGLDDAPAPVVRPAPRRARFSLQRVRARTWGLVAMAASVLVVVAVQAQRAPAPLVPGEGSTARLETERGKMQKATLADGSQVELGGRTALSVRYTRQTRLIIADGGEAYFKVQKNRERPFIVQAGPVTVTAVGTAFTVDREDNSVSVAVTEGVVEVRAAARVGHPDARPMLVRISAGQKVRFDRGELIQSSEPVEAATATSWRSGRLDFKDEPLRLVVARINRYSARQISVSDPSIEDLRVTGTVYGDRVESWLEGVEAVLPVKVTRAEGGRVILSPSLAAQGETAG
jgi:transmembrane sensor